MQNENAKKEAVAIRIGAEIAAAEKEQKVLIIREGKAEEIKYPTKVRLAGTISSPSEFYKKRIKAAQLFALETAHVLYNLNEGTIKLVVNEMFPNENYEVVGSLTPNPDLEAFMINTGNTRTVKETMQFLKMNRLFFSDKDANAKIVTNLQNFKARVEKDIEEIDDLRGNERTSKTQKLETGLSESFDICLPIFKGQPSKSFKVDILCHITDGGVEIYFESRDLKEMEMGAIESIIRTELENFSDIVCIEE